MIKSKAISAKVIAFSVQDYVSVVGHSHLFANELLIELSKPVAGEHDPVSVSTTTSALVVVKFIRNTQLID